jgi:hypothetical protein
LLFALLHLSHPFLLFDIKKVEQARRRKDGIDSGGINSDGINEAH